MLSDVSLSILGQAIPPPLDTSDIHLMYNKTWQRLARDKVYDAYRDFYKQQRQKRKSKKKRKKLDQKSITEVKANFQAKIEAFYKSFEWRKLRYEILKKYGSRCLACGRGPADGAVIHCDHIKPLRKYWHLRLDPMNIQPLCELCNHGKGNWDETDYRKDIIDFPVDK